MNQEELMMNGVQAVIVRLHAKRKAVADCDQTIATQQLVCRLYSQAALLEEYVNAYKSEEEEYARRCALQEAEELRKKQKAMEELRAAIDQPCFRRLAEALDACDAIGLPKEELADAKQEFRARQQRYREELRGEDEEQTQEHEVVKLDGLIARADEAEMREGTTQEKRKHKAASKGGGAGADSKGGARRVERLGLFREIRHPKE